eukprot:NODE_1189_length_961_cov_67.882494_g1144_i0.p1 GENE.NODE_1189_length_961_cov_67.882494_g1144_i0~~NODE_1189_length_961_cov_67.882494_g1144_i0.p1  ORF type:complete len:319 (-),score=74.39 NODE_1189_length_961_cov_67.882494_g1144_i0:4-861(-)
MATLPNVVPSPRLARLRADSSTLEWAKARLTVPRRAPPVPDSCRPFWNQQREFDVVVEHRKAQELRALRKQELFQQHQRAEEEKKQKAAEDAEERTRLRAAADAAAEEQRQERLHVAQIRKEEMIERELLGLEAEDLRLTREIHRIERESAEQIAQQLVLREHDKAVREYNYCMATVRKHDRLAEINLKKEQQAKLDRADKRKERRHMRAVRRSFKEADRQQAQRLTWERQCFEENRKTAELKKAAVQEEQRKRIEEEEEVLRNTSHALVFGAADTGTPRVSRKK